MSLFSRKSSLPEGLRLYAIGDIHGCATLLQLLMGKIEEDMAANPGLRYELVFLGDYVDRGLQSRETINYLLTKLPPSVRKIFLRGNHDDNLLQFLKGNPDRLDTWLAYGGMATLTSYGINPFRPKAEHEQAALLEELQTKIPVEHQRFLQKTVFGYTCGDYFFVHAGIKPGVSITKQVKSDLIWIRDEFLASSADHGKVVVHGHTVAPLPCEKPNRICLDTGAYASGHLTCLVMEGSSRTFLST